MVRSVFLRAVLDSTLESLKQRCLILVGPSGDSRDRPVHIVVVGIWIVAFELVGVHHHVPDSLGERSHVLVRTKQDFLVELRRIDHLVKGL